MEIGGLMIMPDVWTSLVMLLGGFVAGFTLHRVIMLRKSKHSHGMPVWARLRRWAGKATGKIRARIWSV